MFRKRRRTRRPMPARPGSGNARPAPRKRPSGARPTRTRPLSGPPAAFPASNPPPSTFPTHARATPRFPQAALFRGSKMRTCESALSGAVPESSGSAYFWAFENAKIGNCERVAPAGGRGLPAMGGGVAALAALKQKPARSATNRTGGCTICGKPGGATNTCGTDSRGTPRLQRHMAIIPCARSANVQIMCQFALVKS